MGHLLNNKHIFIIEDNASNLAIMKTMLERERATVHFARWAEGTLRKLLALPKLDMILLDLMFPDNVTGFDIFTDIRQHEALKTVPIAAVSATDPSTVLKRLQNEGFAGFIGKPIHIDQFAIQIQHLIAGEKIWNTTPLLPIRK